MDRNHYAFELFKVEPEVTTTEADRLPRQVVTDTLNHPLRRDNQKSHEELAKFYKPSQELCTAINVSIFTGRPLLLTGEPGTGKTQAAYYICHKLNSKVFRFQAKSDSTHRDLIYDFDWVRYLNESKLARDNAGTTAAADSITNQAPNLKKACLDLNELCQAVKYAKDQEGPCTPGVLLIDEIDKAPRDFPNDLLAELDEMKFTIKELPKPIECEPQHRPITVITSNDERRLPDAFLRRCIYHHIVIDEKHLIDIATARHNSNSANGRNANNRTEKRFGSEFIENAAKAFCDLRDILPGKPPATDEFLLWLEVLWVRFGIKKEQDYLMEQVKGRVWRKLSLLDAVILKSKEQIEAFGRL